MSDTFDLNNFKMMIVCLPFANADRGILKTQSAMHEAAAEIERLRARVAELEAERDRLLDACKEAKEWLVAMTLKAAFNQDDKTAQDEAASIVREVSEQISQAIDASARTANGGAE